MKFEETKIDVKTLVPALFVLILILVLTGCSVFSRLIRNSEDEMVEYRCDTAEIIPELELMCCYDSTTVRPEWDSAKLERLGFLPLRSSTVADSIIDYAKQFMGVPYVWAGRGPDKFDCTGFTSYVFRRFGYTLRYTADAQLRDGWKEIKNQNDLRRGDLAFFGGTRDICHIGHVAIVVDNDIINHQFTFIHATLNLGITVSTSTEDYYAKRYITACRVLPEL